MTVSTASIEAANIPSSCSIAMSISCSRGAPACFAWLTDGHTMQFMKFTPEGELLQTIGLPEGRRADTGVPDDDYSSTAWKKVTHGAGPFNIPTDIAFAPDGSMFMSDGYGNARVHKYSADAKYLFSWGEPGKAPG